MSENQQFNVEEQTVNAEAGDSANLAPASVPATSANQDETPVAQEAQENVVSTTEVPAKSRGRKKGKLVNAEDVAPRPSIWPLSLAFALIVMMMGVIVHPIVIGVGAVLVVLVLIAWIRERR